MVMGSLKWLVGMFTRVYFNTINLYIKEISLRIELKDKGNLFG
jgi:hypothetical protein